VNTRKHDGPLLGVLRVVAAGTLVVAALALVIACPWLVLVALACPLFMGVRTH
jgi:ABC-type phosphate transport system permease subunit